MSEFHNKSVIVTGGAKGIGRGICLAFAEQGAGVFCADIDESAGKQIETDGEGLSGSICFQRTDVSLGSECEKLVETVNSESGGVDVLCNNVGIQPTDSYLPAHKVSEEQWDRILAVNLKSFFLMTKFCIPSMKSRGGGVIINTASVQGLQSMKGVPAYAASKGAILSLTRQLALEYAEDKIRVLAINPGTIDTPLLDEVVEASGGNAGEVRRKLAEAHPVGRLGKPDDIAQAVLFLAGKNASFITGDSLCVDGGIMARGSWS
jgi:NAD(P)-dependent dehydrogenase (short-subunit alcohol dehydrogenase family)